MQLSSVFMDQRKDIYENIVQDAYLFTTQYIHITILTKEPFENIMGKVENAGNQHFLIFL